MSPMFKQNVGMTKIYAKGIAELFLIRCNPYHWDGSGEVPDNISFDVYKRKIDETYDGCTLEIQLCKPDGCLCYAASVHLYEGGFWTGHGIGCFDKTAICNDPGSVDALTSAIKQYVYDRNNDTTSLDVMLKLLEKFDDSVVVDYLANPTGWEERFAKVLEQSGIWDSFAKEFAEPFVAYLVQTRQHLDAFSADPSCRENVCKNLMAAV